MQVEIKSYKKNNFITVDNFILTSPYSPEDEKIRFLKRVNFNLLNSTVIVYGLGTGNYISELDKKLHLSNEIIVVEPLLKVIEAYNKSDNKINSERIHLINKSSDDVIEYLAKHRLNSRYKIVYGFMNYRNVFNKKYKKLVENIRNDSIQKLINENTIKKYDQEFTRNIIKNYFLNEFDLPINAMKETYKNIPALIVSGGPSLEKNIEYINQFKGVVISGGRTVEAFLKKSIATDFMVSVDPTKLAFELIRNAPSDQLMPPLFTYSESSRDVVENHNNKKILMNSSSIHLSEENGVLLDVIPNGPSVANVCMAIADYLGCNPIVLIGQDLSYTNGKHHADITEKSFDKETNISSQTIEVDAFYGGKIRTTSSFYSMLTWFEQWIKKSNKTFYNCTEGGVLIDGCEHISFESYLEKQTDDMNISDRFQSICENIEIFKKSKNIDEYLEKIAKLSKQIRKAIYYSNKIQSLVINKNNSKMKHNLKELKKIDSNIATLMEGDSFMNYIFSSALMDFENEKRKMAVCDDTRNSNSNLIFYQSIFKNVEAIKKQLKAFN